tara:strand:- start:1779 stop:2555 length:777 start_codon:yes stop_codon:yes gene_type:complete
MEDDLTILPIREDGTEHKLKRPIHPNLPDISTGALVLDISPVKTGKSTRLVNILENPNYLKDQFDIVYILSNTIRNDRTSRHIYEKYKETAFDDLRNVDDIITNIINYQESFPKKERPFIAVIVDDFVGSVRKNSKLNFLATRFRHYNIGLLLFISQVFRAVELPIRQNATHVIIGSPNPNEKELKKMAEEYGDILGGSKNFMKLYKQATPNRYDFMYINIQSNPTKVYSTFKNLIYEHHDSNAGMNKENTDIEDTDF